MIKKIFVLLFILISLPVMAEDGLIINDILNKEFTGYMGKMFPNNAEKYYHISITDCEGVCNFYIMEGDLETRKNIMYLCDKIILQDKEKIIARCDMVSGLNPMGFVYIKIMKDKLQLDTGYEDIFYASIGDNRECIEKYNSPLSFEKYCNPKTNKDILYLKLYNLHPYNPK